LELIDAAEACKYALTDAPRHSLVFDKLQVIAATGVPGAEKHATTIARAASVRKAVTRVILALHFRLPTTIFRTRISQRRGFSRFACPETHPQLSNSSQGGRSGSCARGRSLVRVCRTWSDPSAA
jgi:hypothetical protein